MKKTLITIFIWIAVGSLFYGATSLQVLAQNDDARTLNDRLNTNITDKRFRLVVCDGPDLRDLKQEITIKFNGNDVQAGNGKIPEGYVPCDFNGVMLTVQHLINIAISAGVIIAILGFFFIRWLYIKGAEKDRSRAKDALWSLLKGFVIMLLAWFIVNQIINWIAKDSSINALLGQ